MYRSISTAVVALVWVGCSNSDNKDDREVISQTPEDYDYPGVLRARWLQESNRSNSGQFYYSYNKQINSKDQVREEKHSRAYLIFVPHMRG